MNHSELRIRLIRCSHWPAQHVPAIIAALLSCIACALASSCAVPTDTEDTGPATPDAQYTQEGTESCLRCHGGDRMTLMATTPHGDTDNPTAPFAMQGCESCHGPGSLHVSRARGGTGFPALLRFGDRKTRPQQTAACLDCHARDMGDVEGMNWTGSLHDTPRITCVSCHVMHAAENPMADPTRQNAKCARCHAGEMKDHPRFEDQGIVFDELSCYDCHDVHQLLPEASEQLTFD